MTKTRKVIGVAFGPGEGFKVQTPTAVVGIKGTDFFTSFKWGITGVLVIDGQLDVFNPSFPDDIVEIITGNTSFISANNPPLPPIPFNEFDKARFVRDTDPNKKAGGTEAEGEETEHGESEAPEFFEVASISPDETPEIPITEPKPDLLPFVEVGKAFLSGSGNITGGNADASMNVVFLAPQIDAAPTIWKTSDILGNWTCISACGGAGTIPLTGNGLNATLGLATFDPLVTKTWSGTLSGSGTYSGTGTLDGSSITFTTIPTGKVSGDIQGTTISGTFTGTGDGTVTVTSPQ